MSDDLSLDRETVDAQRELMGAAPLRVLECGHEKHTHRPDAARCRTCGVVKAVMTPARAAKQAAIEERAAELNDDLAKRARERAAAFRRHAETTNTRGARP